MLQLPKDILINYPHVKTRKFEMCGLIIPPDNSFKRGNILQTHHCLEIVLSGCSRVYNSVGHQDLKIDNIQFRKRGTYLVQPSEDYSGLLFFIENEFILAFLKEHVETYSKENFKADLPPFLFESSEFINANVKEAMSVINEPGNFPSCIVKLSAHHILLQLLDKAPTKTFVTFLKYIITDRKIDLSYFMETNFTQNMNLKTMAKQTGRSLSAFKSDFHKIFETSPKKWLIQRRLMHAHYLIQNATGSISDIAYQCGFENVSHFSKAYRSKYGMSPSESRK